MEGGRGGRRLLLWTPGPLSTRPSRCGLRTMWRGTWRSTASSTRQLSLKNTDKHTNMSGPAFQLQSFEHMMSSQYPIEAPVVTFISPIPLHPHIYSNGHICLSILYDQVLIYARAELQA